MISYGNVVLYRILIFFGNLWMTIASLTSEESTNHFPVYLFNFRLAKYDVIPPSLIRSSEECLEEILVNGEDDIVEVGCDVPEGGRDWGEDFSDVM